MARPRQTTCTHGHPFTPATVWLNVNGSQECVVCHRRRSRLCERRHRAHLSIVDDKQPATIALVVWRAEPGARDIRASWTYHRSRAAASALAPTDGTPFTVVNIARKPWIHHLLLGK